MRRVFRQIVSAITTNITGKVIGALGAVVLARFLGATDYGLFSLVFAIVVMINGFTDIGIYQAVQKYAAETDRDEDIAWTGFTLDSSLTLAAFIATVAVVSQIEEYAQKPLGILLILTALYLIPSAFDIFGARLQARRRIELISGLSLLYVALSSGLAILLVVLRFGVMGAIVGFVAAKTITTLLTLKYGYKKGRFDGKIARKLLGFGLLSFAASISWLAVGRLDRVIIAIYIPDLAVLGMYSVAQSLSDMILIIPAAFVTVASPIISRAYAEGDMGRVQKIYEIGFLGTLIYILLAVAGGLLLAEPLIRWVFGRQYLPAVPLFRIVIFASALVGISQIGGMMLTMTSKIRLNALTNILQGGTSLLLLLLLTPILGVVGAALTDILVMGLGLALTYYFVTKTLRLRITLNRAAVMAFYNMTLEQLGLRKKKNP